MATRPLLDALALRELAAAAAVDERTLTRFLAGKPIRAMGSARIVRAFVERGYEKMLPKTSSPRRKSANAVA